MKRRDFSTSLLGAGLGATALGLAGAANAQGGPVEGTNYIRLSQPLPASGSGKIEVVEFFWYGCPHCNAFEPALDAWQKRLPADVAFRRLPVAFRAEPFVAHQRIFFALDEMDAVDAMHRKVFRAIHVEHMRLDKPEDIAAFMAANGIDGTRFLTLFQSFSVQTRAAQATQLAAAYRIDGVPALGIQGRYYTSGVLAGTNERALAVADFLVERVRKSV